MLPRLAPFRQSAAVLAGIAAVFLFGGLVPPVQAEHAGLPLLKLSGTTRIGYSPVNGLEGRFTVAGSDTMQPLMLRLASEFHRMHPNTKIAVQGGGSELAMMQFLENQAAIRRGDARAQGHLVSGKVALLASSRSLNDEERRDFRSRFGFDAVEMPIALDAVAIYVHRDNPIHGLTLEQVDGVFSQSHKRGSQDIRTWGQLGLEDRAAQRIAVHGRDKKSGTRSFFKHVALLDGELRDDVQEAIGSASEILAISRDPWAIGYAGAGFQTSYVRMIPIAEKADAPFVLPTQTTTADRSYPLSRHLFLYANQPVGELEPAVREFLKFINSTEGQLTVAKAG
ncbi:MAG TPA: PstS family phosphate ABC transporter substrate-binding protein, partial [Nitrospiraceae bacterium]|nr:PstS family phosphate ABC transporter substrate-binding protein [Nitrospiraceae bacterium]